VEETLRNDPEVSMGVVAPYEPSPDLDYHELFAMSWSLITPPRHPLAGKRRARLQHLIDQPLIIYERGSTGRQHILDAFHESGLVPRVALETTSTETIVSMVEAGLGISIVPLLPSGAVTRGRRVHAQPLDAPIRPIHSGVLIRKSEKLSASSLRLFDFIRSHFAQ
jgi:DNA-binding transcriptional LysR family regulator